MHRALNRLFHRFSEVHFPALAMYRYKVGRLISKAAAIAVLDSPVAIRLLSSFTCVAFTKRNMAAHPSLVILGAPEAEDTISSLIQNVVLVLK